MSTEHLSAREVELSYLGCRSQTAETHASHCAPCASELAELSAERDALLSRLRPEAYAQRLVREHRRNLWRDRCLKRATGGLAIAAAMAGLLIREEMDATRPRASVPDEVAFAFDDTAQEAAPGDLLAKGDTSFAVIRKRGAQIQMLEGVLTVEPGDEIRLRFVCSARCKTAAGVVMDGGDWTPLFSDDYAPGAHTPEATLRVTEDPGAGLILLGTPQAVAAARAGKPARVHRARLIWSPKAARLGTNRETRPFSEVGTLDAPAR